MKQYKKDLHRVRHEDVRQEVIRFVEETGVDTIAAAIGTAHGVYENEEIKFDLLGCFVFSAEEGTPAYKMRPKIAKRVAEKRQSDIMVSQKAISRKANTEKLDKVIKVTIESIAPDDRAS